MNLREELEGYIKANDAQGLSIRITKRGRPRRETQAITEYDKNHCLEFAIREANLEVIDTLIRHGAQLTTSSFSAAINREKPALLELLIE
jgi:hypothetical protein